MVAFALLALTNLAFAADAQDGVADKEFKKLQGTWVMVSGEQDGAKIADEHIKKSKITWKGKEVFVDTPHQSKETIRGTVKIDPTRQPREMEWTRSAGPGEGKTMRAIYEFIDDDHYRVCFAPPEKVRPKEFSTKPGSGHMLHVWKRMKD